MAQSNNNQPKTYFVAADIIDGNEPAYINHVIQRLQETGNETIYGGVGPNKVQAHGRTSESQGQIGVYIAGGYGLGTPMDFHVGIKENGYYHYEKVFMIGSYEFTHNKYLRSESMDTPASRCEPGMSTIHCSRYIGKTPREFNQEFTGCQIIYADTLDQCIDVILGSSGGGSGTTVSDIKMGYSKNKPFSAYYTINYFIDDNRSDVKTILVDFSHEAPTTSYKSRKYDVYSFSNKIGAWVNNHHSVNAFNLLEKFQIANNDLEGKHKYYIKDIRFTNTFSKKDGTEYETPDKTRHYGLYDPSHDEASYKMLLYGLGFFSGEVGNSTDFDTFGEDINSGLKRVLKDTSYITCMNYKKHRCDDVILFKNVNNNHKVQCVFVEDPYANNNVDKDTVYIPIVGVSNVKYAPLNNLLTNYIVTFQELYDLFEETHLMSACSYLDLEKYMRYGELSKTSNLHDTYGLYEARYIAHNSYLKENNDETTLSVTCEGFPPCSVGDYVGTVMYSPELTNIYKVCSIEVNVNKDTRPIIQTTLGLGDIDRHIKVDEMLQEQRKHLSPLSNDLSYARYVGRDEHLWGVD